MIICTYKIWDTISRQWDEKTVSANSMKDIKDCLDKNYKAGITTVIVNMWEETENGKMTNDDVFKIGLALNHIGYMIPDDRWEDFKKQGDIIQDIILKYTEEKEENK